VNHMTIIALCVGLLPSRRGADPLREPEGRQRAPSCTGGNELRVRSLCRLRPREREPLLLAVEHPHGAAMTYAGRRHTAKQMDKVLPYAWRRTTAGAFRNSSRSSTPPRVPRPAARLRAVVSNALWPAKVPLSGDYVIRVRVDFAATFENWTTLRPRGPANDQRAVASQDQDRIKDWSPQRDHAIDRLILTNAIYFKRTGQPVHEEATKPPVRLSADRKKDRPLDERQGATTTWRPAISNAGDALLYSDLSCSPAGREGGRPGHGEAALRKRSPAGGAVPVHALKWPFPFKFSGGFALATSCGDRNDGPSPRRRRLSA